MSSKLRFLFQLISLFTVLLQDAMPYVVHPQSGLFSKPWSRVLSMVNPKPSGFAGSRKGKEKVVEKTTPLIDNSYFLAVLPIKGATKEAIDSLRDMLPPETTASVIKNSVMKVCIQSAVNSNQFLPLTADLSEENMFLFIKEGFSAPSYKALQQWRKDTGRTGPEYELKSCVAEGTRYSGQQQLADVLSVTSKSDLLAELVRALQYIPIQLVRTLTALSATGNVSSTTTTAGVAAVGNSTTNTG